MRERVESLEISVPFVRSELNMADFFTKPLLSATFFRFRNAIMNVSSSDAAQAAFVHGGVLKDTVTDSTVTDIPSIGCTGKGAP